MGTVFAAEGGGAGGPARHAGQFSPVYRFALRADARQGIERTASNSGLTW